VRRHPFVPTSICQRGLVPAPPPKRVPPYRGQPSEKQEAESKRSLNQEVDPQPVHGIPDAESGGRTAESKDDRSDDNGGSQTHPPKRDLLPVGKRIEQDKLPALKPSGIDDSYHPPPTDRLEDTVPEGVRWMAERIERYVVSRTEVSEDWRRQTRRVLRSLVLACGPASNRKGPVFVRLGFEAPTSA
jgi:hypothetical protein